MTNLPKYVPLLPDDEATILDTIVDAEMHLQRANASGTMAPIAVEVQQARHKRAREALSRLTEENRNLRKRNQFLETIVPANKEHA